MQGDLLCCKENILHYTIMDFLLSKYGVIFTEYDWLTEVETRSILSTSVNITPYLLSKMSITFHYIVKRCMSLTYVPVYSFTFVTLTCFHALYFGASCIHSNSIVQHRILLLEKQIWMISRYFIYWKRSFPVNTVSHFLVTWQCSN